MEKMKYVKLRRYNEVIIFPLVLQHSVFKHLSPISAGFCYINSAENRVDCYGESISLKLTSDKTGDTYHATMQVFGADYAFDILSKSTKL